MESSRQQEHETSPREKFITAAHRGKILCNRCLVCQHLMLVTVYYCEQCFSRKLESMELEGIGKVVTYTIQAVAPEEFEDAGSYAWVIFSIDGTDLRMSGFLSGIMSSSAIPIGSTVRVLDYHPKHGLSMQRV